MQVVDEKKENLEDRTANVTRRDSEPELLGRDVVNLVSGMTR